MVDDTNYITPHEAALAVVATAMKKARLHITTLILNALMGGFLFSSGSMLYIMIHANSPSAETNNPGLLDILGGIGFGIGLFYVVIMGVDLYNSNILFFSVGLLRGAISIWDLLISWFVSIFGNIGGSLFMSYILVHLSTISRSADAISASIRIAEEKVHPNFIEIFLKGCGGNFFVCLAIYLQLMAKPLHVKCLMLVLPVLTFVTIGFSHTIADMGLMFTAMLNGTNVTVAEYIWKILIPTALGNALGGFMFSLILPFYLHLVVVERDRKRLSLPTYEARDEQPELNMDSRVVRITSKERKEFDDVDETDSSNTSNAAMSEFDNNYNEKYDLQMHDQSTLSRRSTAHSRYPTKSISHTTTATTEINNDSHSNTNLNAENNNTDSHEWSSNDLDSSMYNPSFSLYSANSDVASVPEPYYANVSQKFDKDNHDVLNKASRSCTLGLKDVKRHIRSPPGVFPVRGMGAPLIREKHIEDPTYIDEDLKPLSEGQNSHDRNENILSRIQTASSYRQNVIERIKTIEKEEKEDYKLSGGYDVEQSKPSAQLKRVLTRIVTSKHSTTNHDDIETGTSRTTQSPFPFNRPDNVRSYDTVSVSESTGSGFKSFYSQRRKSFREVGITGRAAMMANNTAGVDNYSLSDINQHNKTPQMSRFPSNATKKFGELSRKSSLIPRKTQSFHETVNYLKEKNETKDDANHLKKVKKVTTYNIGEHDEGGSSDESKSDSTLNNEH